MGDNCRIQECREEFKEIHTSIKGVEKCLNSMNEVLIKNTESLIYHSARSDRLEKIVEQQQKYMYISLGIFTAIQILLPFLMK